MGSAQSRLIAKNAFASFRTLMSGTFFAMVKVLWDDKVAAMEEPTNSDPLVRLSVAEQEVMRVRKPTGVFAGSHDSLRDAQLRLVGFFGRVRRRYTIRARIDYTNGSEAIAVTVGWRGSAPTSAETELRKVLP
jgi:hypothetical protein